MTPVQRFNRHTPPPLILVTSFQVWAGQGSVCTPPPVTREPEQASGFSTTVSAVPLRQTLSKGGNMR